MVTQAFDYIVGVDTHAKTHTYSIIDTATGTEVACHSFDTTPNAMTRAINWIGRHTSGTVLAAIEGTGSYGAHLTRLLGDHTDIQVCDVRPPKRRSRRGKGKSDQIDAAAAARTALAQNTTHLAQPRCEGTRSALRVLIAARRLINTHRTANIAALTALIRREDLGMMARRALTKTQINQITAWRNHPSDQAHQAIARTEAIRLAKTITTADPIPVT